MMASEILTVPEEHLLEVCAIIRAGMKARRKGSKAVFRYLTEWCDEEEEYMRQCGEGD